MKRVAFTSGSRLQCSKSILLWIVLVLLSSGTATAADLRVVVRDDDQAPLSGVNVYAYTQAGAYAGSNAVTDASGVAQFGDVGLFAAGTYKFKAVWLKQDFWVENIDLPATPEATLEIPTAPLTATVTSAGQAVDGVKVYLFNEAGAYLSMNTVTDGGGQAMFLLPTVGTFKLRADILGSQYWSESFQVAGSGAAVAVDAGGGRLSVTLQKDAAQPMAGIKMYLFNTAGSYLGRSLTTDGAGLGAFDVSAGTYRIRADYLGYHFWSADTTVGADTSLAFTIPHQDVTIAVNGRLGDTAPIEGAKVYLFTEAGSYVGLNQVSDADGRVSFSLPDQSYKARADYMKGQFWSDPFQFADHTLTIPMAEAEVSVLWGGAPLDGVPVYLFTTSGSYAGVRIDSGADGISLFRMPAGQWKFRADYQTNQYWTADVDLPADVTTPVELSTGGGTMTFGVTLYKNEEEPLEGVNCYVFNESGAYTGVGSATNSQGEVQFDLAAGQYQIRVDYLGYQFWSETYDVGATLSDVFHIPHQDLTVTVNGVLDAPQPLENLPVYLFTETGGYLSQKLTTDAAGQVVFTLPDKAFKVRVDYMGQQFWSPPFTGQPVSVEIPMADAQVSVTGGAGHGIPDAKVYVFSENQAYLNLNGVTDGSGRVDFRLPGGTYLFRTTHLGHTFWSAPVQLAGQSVQPVEIAAGGGAFTFTLLADPNQALANTKCYLFDGDAQHYLNMWSLTDENGQLNFELVDGTYTIRVDHLGYQFFTAAFQVPETLDQVFTIPHLQVPVTVNGVLATPSPLEGVKVYLFNAAGAYQNRNQVTDADGNVYFSLPPREYKVRADYLKHQYWSAVFNQTPANVNIPLARTQVRVQGVGEPLEGIKVYAFDESGSYIGISAVSDEQGQAEFILPTQRFKFRADYQGSQFWSDVVELAGGRLNTVTIDTGGGTLRLRVEKDAYHPLEGSKCYVYSAAGKYLGLFGTTGAQGQVSFKLADGQYKVKLNYAGYEFWSDELTMDQDMAHTLTIAHERRDLHVWAINPGPEPLQDLTAYVYSGAGKYIGLTDKTDADGNVAFDLPQKDYKAKVVYNGQAYWSQTLQPTGTLIAINRDGTPILPPVAAFDASVNGANQVVLSWTAPADTNGITVGGYHLYRRRRCQAAFERIDSVPIPADATAYTDAQVSPPDTYLYYIAAVSDAGVQGEPSPILAAGFDGELDAQNTAGINGLTASWQQGVASLTWSDQAGCTYQVYRGTDPAALVPWARSDTASFGDSSSSPYQTWYFQVATVQTFCHPATGQPVELIGPASAVVTLAGLTAPVVTTPDLQVDADGDYVITTGAGQGYLLEGNYSGFDGDVTVTAVLGDVTVTGAGANGQFTIELPTAGDWQIIISDADGWQSATIDTQWQIDDQPPTLTVDGSTARTTTGTVVTITGAADDAQSDMQAVRITSDRYPGTTFGTSLGSLGIFSGEVPLQTGVNQLTVTASDVYDNSTSQSITVTQIVTSLPVVQITSPLEGATVITPRVDVTGTVRSNLPPEQIRLVLADRVDFPAGDNNQYTFSFDNVDLVEGGNIISVRAETQYGNVTAQVTVNYTSGGTSGQVEPPRIEVLSPLPEAYLTESPVVTGLVRSDLGIQAVTVNGQAAQATGLGTGYVSFKAAPAFSDGEQALSIIVTATDLAGHSSTLTYPVHLDTTAPQIVLDISDLQAPPAVNTTTANPYAVGGTITETHIAGASINGQPIDLSPGPQAGTYTFSASLPLAYGNDQNITLSAWDLAGNRTGTEWLVRLSSDLAIEVIAPRNGAELQGQGDQTPVEVTVRVSGAQGDDVFKAAVDDGPLQPMNRAGAVGNAAFSVATDTSDHRLSVQVENGGGTVLSTAATTFTIRNMGDVELSVEKLRPASGATGVEPNDYIAIHFNKNIDPDLLQVLVLETAHGNTYDTSGKGEEITELSDVKLMEVHRDREPVPGGISFLPGNRMAAFYPARDLAYGAYVYVNVTYDGNELMRTSYRVRDLPSLMEGFVTDSAANSISGVKVYIPKLDLTAVTNSDGAYNFGFGMDASHALPAGRYRLIFNPGRQNSAYGTLEYRMRVREGVLNSVPVIKLPVISKEIPFRRIISGRAENILAGGALKLDLGQTRLTFPDLRQQGDVHVQFLSVEQLPYAPLPYATPLWMFCIQPMGVKVSGNMGLTLAVPKRSGDYDYLDNYDSLVVLVGLDPDSLMIVPVGVGRIDTENHTVTSVGQVQLERLDFIGYATVKADARPLLEQYIDQEIGLRQMTAGLESLPMDAAPEGSPLEP